MMDRIERIRLMENMLDRALAAERFDEVLLELNLLYGYYFSPLWLGDYEADEQGLIPSGVRRGVLSQDTLYDLLTEWKNSYQEDSDMETYYYVCPVCGFVYQVPDYWVSYAPEDTMDFLHINFKTGQPCENQTLNKTDAPAE